MTDPREKYCMRDGKWREPKGECTCGKSNDARKKHNINSVSKHLIISGKLHDLPSL